VATRRRVRLRYGRLGAAASSLGVTSVAVLGGFGLLPSSAQPAERPAIAPAAATPSPAAAPDLVRPESAGAATTPGERVGVSTGSMLPGDSGAGRRVVFSQTRQRVWLVGRDGGVRRTYLVSGSVHDNLDPGSYDVYSRSMHALGVDDSGTMRYFVRFTQGDTGAAIGFHDIPVDEGQRVQSVAELGTPTSHGCIRQRPADARAMWEFARLGTTVVVVA
jgi:hypothetical protein